MASNTWLSFDIYSIGTDSPEIYEKHPTFLQYSRTTMNLIFINFTNQAVLQTEGTSILITSDAAPTVFFFLSRKMKTMLQLEDRRKYRRILKNRKRIYSSMFTN